MPACALRAAAGTLLVVSSPRSAARVSVKRAYAPPAPSTSKLEVHTKPQPLAQHTSDLPTPIATCGVSVYSRRSLAPEDTGRRSSLGRIPRPRALSSIPIGAPSSSAAENWLAHGGASCVDRARARIGGRVRRRPCEPVRRCFCSRSGRRCHAGKQQRCAPANLVLHCLQRVSLAVEAVEALLVPLRL